MCKHFNIDNKKHSIDLTRWTQIISEIENPVGKVKIAIVGKYVSLKEAYKSLCEAITHASIAKRVEHEVVWIDAETAQDI